MTIKAEQTDQTVEEAVDTTTVVESTQAEKQVPETEETPENTQPSSEEQEEQPQIDPREAEIQMYLDAKEKYSKDPTYEMSDEEADAFLNVTDRIQSGEIQEPVRKSQEETTEKKQESEEKVESKEEAAEAEPEPSETEEKTNYSEEEATSLMEAMKKVGAKDITELPSKVDGLIKQMTATGGRQGNELAQIKKEKESHIAWMQNLAKGDESAIEYLLKVAPNLADKFSPNKSNTSDSPTTSKQKDEGSSDADEYIDDRLAAEVRELKETIKKQNETITKLSKTEEKRAEEQEYSQAVSSWVEDIVDVVEEFKDDFGLTSSEARGLAKAYWSPDSHTQPINPRFQKVHELILYANKGGYPSLRSAHIVLQQENGTYAKKIAAARKEGQLETQKVPSTNAALSNRQSKIKQTVPDPHITDDSVERMLAGDFTAIPDNWMDEDGMLLKDKIPHRFHKRLGI